jgi:hypothetical protein
MTISRLLASAAVALATKAASAQDARPTLLDCTKTPSELSDVQPIHGAARSGNAEVQLVKDRLHGGADPPLQAQGPRVKTQLHSRGPLQAARRS